MLRDLTDFRVVKITTLKSSKSLIISVLWVAPLRSAVLPPLKSGGSTLESGYPTSGIVLPPPLMILCIRATPPLRALLPLNPNCHTETRVVQHKNPSCSTSGVGCSYFCNRVVSPLRALPPPNPNCHTGTRVVPHQESGAPTSQSSGSTSKGPSTTDPELFHIRSRVIPLWNHAAPPLKVLLPQNPGPSTTESELPHRTPSCSTSGIRSVPPPNPSCSTQESGYPTT